jgi:hypothetical protein
MIRSLSVELIDCFAAAWPSLLDGAEPSDRVAELLASDRRTEIPCTDLAPTGPRG